MTGTRIVDYNIRMEDEIRRLFADIYPGQPEIADLMCYDPMVPNHVTTKVTYHGGAMVGQTNIFLHKALDGNANLGFHVHPSMHGKGIATALCREAIEEARSKGITLFYIRTHADNVAAIAVARKLGFTQDESLSLVMGLAVFVKCLDLPNRP